ncbi:MAG TPA: hypothetical protein VF084_13670 [Nitrososphaeraceae archaeon]
MTIKIGINIYNKFSKYIIDKIDDVLAGHIVSQRNKTNYFIKTFDEKFIMHENK